MSHCTAGVKATVNYTSKEGIKSKFITKNTPIDIECADKTRTGKFIYTLTDYGYAVNCASSGQLFTDEITADSYQVQGTTNPGEFAACAWNQVTFFIGTEQVFSAKKTSRYSVSQVNNPNYSKGGKTLTIKNAQGTKLFEAEVKDCNHTVACGEECPEGQCKCPTQQYPGYCCVDCQQVASKINNLASKAGGCC